jgi:hypothetical protein
MACTTCGDTTYPDGQKCFSCASESVERYVAERDRREPIEKRMEREPRPMKKAAKAQDPDQGQLL